MPEGGERNLFGTLYELLVFRHLVADQATLQIDCKEGHEELEVTFHGDRSLLDALRQLAGEDAQVQTQRGDSDLVAEGSAGVVLAQLKVSLQPGENGIDKSELKSILVAAARHWARILDVDPSLSLTAFLLVTNRPPGNVAGLQDELNQFEASPPSISDLPCPTVLGESPACRKDRRNVKPVTIGAWCQHLVESDGLSDDLVRLVAKILVGLRYVYLPPAVCEANFYEAMTRLGLNNQEADGIGTRLFGEFIRGSASDLKSAEATLRRAVFDSPAEFHTLCASDLWPIERVAWTKGWRGSNFHHDLDDMSMIVPVDSKFQEARRGISAVETEGKSGLIISGPGGVGKSHLLYSLVHSMREDGQFLMIPCPDYAGVPRRLEAAATQFFSGYRFDHGYPKWVNRIRAAQAPCGRRTPLWLYLPNTDDLDAAELRLILQDIGLADTLGLKVLFTARSEVWARANQATESKFEEIRLDRFDSLSIKLWLKTFGVDEFGGTLGPDSQPLSEDDLQNVRARRLAHPLLFSALAAILRPFDISSRKVELQSYLTGATPAEPKFWRQCDETIAMRLNKYPPLLGENPQSLREAFKRLYAKRDDLPTFGRDEFNDHFFDTVARENREKLRAQFTQVGILEWSDASGSRLRWALEEYKPNSEEMI